MAYTGAIRQPLRGASIVPRLSATSESILAWSDRRRRNRERALEHIYAELENTVEAVWATLTPPDQLTWSETICWANSIELDDGTLQIQVHRTVDEVRDYYAHVYATKPPDNFELKTLLVGDWWVAVEAPIEYRHPATGTRSQSVSAALLILDGVDGVSGELVWRKHQIPPPGQTDMERLALLKAILAALETGDAEAAVATMDGDVRAAVRDYGGGDEVFVRIDGRTEMLAYYRRFLDQVEVLGTAVQSLLVRDWFVNAEVEWDVRFRRGELAGRTARMRTVENLYVGASGLFIARIGYGSPLELRS
jgi:hypothetical protein